MLVFVAIISIEKSQNALAVEQVQTTDKSSDLVLTIEASRDQLYAGSGFGLTGRIKNISSKPITLTESKTVLVLPPELQDPRVPWNIAWYGFFPTETKPSADTKPQVTPGADAKTATDIDAKPQTDTETKVILAPNYSYVVKWAWDTNEQLKLAGEPQNALDFLVRSVGMISPELLFTFFSPGDYKVDAVVLYPDPDSKETSRAVVQSAVLHVNTPELVLLLGSAIGGLIGYVITLIYLGQARSTRFKWYTFVIGSVGSMLLAAVVVILLARISESQFLVRISVNDFWGATAIGVITSIAGIRILSRLIPSIQGTPRSDTQSSNDSRDETIPTEDQIRERAYLISEQRRTAGIEGDQRSDWTQAENELKSAIAEQKRSGKKPTNQNVNISGKTGPRTQETATV